MRARLAILAAGTLAFGSLGTLPAAADGMRSRAPVADGCMGAFGGSYIGAHIGLGSYRPTWHEQSAPDDIPTPDKSFQDTAVIGGGQIGYNRHCGTTLVGIESDFAATNLSVHKSFTGNLDGAGGGDIDTDRYGSKVSWYGTTRLRAGIVSDNRMLMFLTGGLAYAKFRHSLTDGIDPTDPTELEGLTGSSSNVRFGWTVGAGIEYLISDRVSLKADALYLDFGNHKAFTTGTGVETESYRIDDSFWVGRLGFNIKLHRESYETVPLK